MLVLRARLSALLLFAACCSVPDLALAAADSGAAEPEAAPAPPPRCDVRLWQLSYDDPEADDAEFLELQLIVHAGSPETWGDCGVQSLELLNGATPECAPYNRITLAEFPVGSTVEQLRFCVATDLSVQSSLPTACQQGQVSDKALKHGWLQNGPDALRVLSTQGTPLVSYSYGGAEHCADVSLPKEKGKILDEQGGESDDVIAWCDDQQSYALISEHLLEGEARRQACEQNAPPLTPASDPTQPLTELDAATSSTAQPEYEEPLSLGTIHDGGIISIQQPVFFDGGGPPQVTPTNPETPQLPGLGCMLDEPAAQRSVWLPVSTVALWLLLWIRRKQF